MYTANTSKVGSQISGEPVERSKLHEQRRNLKFDVPKLEVSKVYKLLLERGYTGRLLQQLGNIHMSANTQDNQANNNDTIEIQETEVVPSETNSLQSGLTSLIPMVLIFAVFYFLLLRPQETRRKEREKLVSEVKKGEEVLTNSGIYGIVTKVSENDNNIEIEIAKDVRIKVLKSAIIDITSRTKEVAVKKENKKNKKVSGAKAS
ncbi:Preprotein translocase YajC subunit [Rickettsia africae ESF-5]|uniref:Sec translocon accessory complex subunit YajC n=2 Tax=Rickettsia africae TaxID=35788 RepID=C3PP21_RICAE|nr:Preprotein translocase YajC subunit [Rickettsia africae ESF-5]